MRGLTQLTWCPPAAHLSQPSGHRRRVPCRKVRVIFSADASRPLGNRAGIPCHFGSGISRLFLYSRIPHMTCGRPWMVELRSSRLSNGTGRPGVGRLYSHTIVNLGDSRRCAKRRVHQRAGFLVAPQWSAINGSCDDLDKRAEFPSAAAIA